MLTRIAIRGLSAFVVLALIVSPVYAEPADQTVSVTAWVSNSTPAQYTTVTVYAQILVNSVGKAGIPVTFYWYYKTVTRTCTGTTSSKGIAKCSRYISGATRGRSVPITASFTVNGNNYTAQTSFTPK